MNSDVIVFIVILAYAVWAVYSGWKIMNGRFEFLEQKTIPIRILKVISIILVGSVYGVINLTVLVITNILKLVKLICHL